MSCLCECLKKFIGQNKNETKEERAIYNNKLTNLISKKKDINFNDSSKDDIIFNNNNNLPNNLEERKKIPIIINNNNYFNNTKPHFYEMKNLGENKLNEKNNNERNKLLSHL